MIFLKMNPLSGSPFDDTTRSELEHLVVSIKRAKASLDHTALSRAQLIRQHRMFVDALTFMEGALRAGNVDPDQLRRYARAASVDVEQNMHEAGAAQVNGLHAQLLKWRNTIPADEWNKIRFIVHGPQQPRGGHAATLYLSAVLKDAGDGRGYVGENTRLVYREDTSLPPNSNAEPWEADLQLLAAVTIDATASQALFSDSDRLAVDIAADGARARITELDLTLLQPTSK
jgi:hypothetical protein